MYQCLWVTCSHTNCVSVNPYNPNPQFLKELLEDLLVPLSLYNSHRYFSALCSDFCFLPFPCHRLQSPTTAVFVNCAANRPRKIESNGILLQQEELVSSYCPPTGDYVLQKSYSSVPFQSCLAVFFFLIRDRSWSYKSNSLGNQLKFAIFVDLHLCSNSHMQIWDYSHWNFW